MTAIVVEVQLAYRAQKQWAWPSYVTNARRTHQCPTSLLVVCPNPSAAQQCARPIHIGHPGRVLRPVVVGADAIPVVADPTWAVQETELAVLSAYAHVGDPGGEKIIEAALIGLGATENEHAGMYAQLIDEAAPP